VLTECIQARRLLEAESSASLQECHHRDIPAGFVHWGLLQDSPLRWELAPTWCLWCGRLPDYHRNQAEEGKQGDAHPHGWGFILSVFQFEPLPLGMGETI